MFDITLQNFKMLLVNGWSDARLKVSLILDRIAVPVKEQVYSSGFLLDLGLLLDNQVVTVARNAFYQLQLVSQLWPLLGKKFWTRWSLVLLHLDYITAVCSTWGYP